MPGNLWDSGSSHSEEEEVVSKLKINESYEKRYQERKEKEELSRLTEKYGDKLDAADDEDSTSEEEDVNGELVTPEVDSQIFQTIAKIKAKNPEIYNSNKTFFDEQEIAKIRRDWEEKMRQRKAEGRESVTLKEYQRQLLLDTQGKLVDEDESSSLSVVKTRDQEQSELKDAFVAAASDISTAKDKADDLFEVTAVSQGDASGDRYRSFLLESLKESDVGSSTLAEWDALQKNPQVNPDEAFLMNYVLNRGWMDAPNKEADPFKDSVDLSEDEKDVDEMETFEQKHNFRFEEEGSSRITTYSREVPDSLRRSDTRRKESRKRKSERELAEMEERQRELVHLRELADRERRTKIEQIRQVASLKDVADIDLDGEFDPDKHDAQLGAIFNDSYYKGDAADGNSDDEDFGINSKPIFKDDIDVSDLVPKLEDTEDTAHLTNKQKKKLAKKLQKQQGSLVNTGSALVSSLHERVDENDVEEEQPKQHRRDQKKIEKELKKKIKNFNDYMEYFFPIACEDIVGEVKTRFKYQSVPKKDYGLANKEMLMADEKLLNEYVSLKRLAPYRRGEQMEKDEQIIKKLKKKKVYQIRKAIKELEEQS